MKTGESSNEYGVRVSHHLCESCGGDFTVTPAAGDGPGWEGCLGCGCPSYDRSRVIEAGDTIYDRDGDPILIVDDCE